MSLALLLTGGGALSPSPSRVFRFPPRRARSISSSPSPFWFRGVSVLPMTFRLFNDLGPHRDEVRHRAGVCDRANCRYPYSCSSPSCARFPHELDEAALIDGCGRFRPVLARHPAAKPERRGSRCLILAFVAIWNDYLTAPGPASGPAEPHAVGRARIRQRRIPGRLRDDVGRHRHRRGADCCFSMSILKERIATGMAAGAVKG